MISDLTQAKIAAPTMRPPLYTWLGLVLGSVMPLVAALLFPTYMHQMQPSWLEWTRLFELPFIACELAIILAAARDGHSDGSILRAVPCDVAVALLLVSVGLFAGSVFLSKNVAASVLLSATTVIHLRFATAIYHFARRERGRGTHLLLPWLGLGLLPLAALTWWRFSFPPAASTVMGGVIEWSSALPGFISVRHFGSWTGAIAAGLLVQLGYGERQREPLTCALYVVATGLTCWSGTRAALLAMAVAALITGVSQRALPPRGRLAAVLGLTVTAYLGAVLFRFDDPSFLLFVPSDSVGADAMSGGRLDLWYATLMRWSQSPLFGWGSGSTFWEVNIGWHHTQPHNVLLQFLISWGLIGTIGGTWLLARAIYASHRVGMADPRLRALTAMLYALLVMSLLEGMLYYPRFIMLIASVFGILLAERENAACEESS